VPAAGGKKRKAAVPCQKATERKFCGAWKAAEEAQLQQLVHALGEGVVWEDVASRLGTGRSGSAVREHWAEHRKRRKAADELQAKLREEADEERAEAASAAPRVALKLPWPPQAGAAAAVVPQDVTDLTLTSPMRSCVLSDGPPLPPTTLPPLPPTLRRLRLVHAAAHLSEEGWAAISGCISLRELDIDWGGDELARLDTPPPDLRTLRLTHVDYARGSSRPPPAFFERLGARRTLRTLVVSGSCDLPAACLHALRGCPLRELVLEGGRDDGYALAHPHAAALPTLVALAPGLRTLELTGTDLSKREAAALNNRLPPGCSATHFPPPKKDFEPYYEWAQRQQEAEEAGAPRTSGRISPQYDKYGYSGWGNYRRRHDFSRSTSHREEHGIYARSTAVTGSSPLTAPRPTSRRSGGDVRPARVSDTQTHTLTRHSRMARTGPPPQRGRGHGCTWST